MDYRRLIDMNEQYKALKARYARGLITFDQYVEHLEIMISELDKNYIRLDDPVVTGLVEALRNFEQTCYSRDNYLQAHKALSAYEARVKEVSRE